MTEISSAVPSHFLNISNDTEILTLDSLNDEFQNVDFVMILSTLIASVGIVANFTVIIVFLNDKKLRKKIPNIFIIHQVSFILHCTFQFCFWQCLPWVSNPRWIPFLVCFTTCVQWIPQIYFWCNTCRPLDDQHGNQSLFPTCVFKQKFCCSFTYSASSLIYLNTAQTDLLDFFSWIE